MKLNKDTKLKDILAAYPQLKDILPEVDKRFKRLETPLGRLFLKRATLYDLSRKSGVSTEKLIVELKKLVEKQ